MNNENLLANGCSVVVAQIYEDSPRCHQSKVPPLFSGNTAVDIFHDQLNVCAAKETCIISNHQKDN